MSEWIDRDLVPVLDAVSILTPGAFTLITRADRGERQPSRDVLLAEAPGWVGAGEAAGRAWLAQAASSAVAAAARSSRDRWPIMRSPS